MGIHPVSVTQALSKEDIEVDGCDRAWLNGHEILVQSIPWRLAVASSDVCQLVLSKGEVSVQFTLDFRIASKQDLLGVEEQFIRTARSRQLDVRAVEEFIAASSGYRTAIGYCDGICSYLYGIMAKESYAESSLKYEAYVGKFTKSAVELAVYERPIARTIGSLIAFHFNQFKDVSKLAHHGRVGQAAAKYAAWTRGGAPEEDSWPASSNAISELEALLTDWNTERIIRWAIHPLDKLTYYVSEMESFLNQRIEEYDSVKIHLLLGEVYATSCDVENALRHARALRNLSAMEKWAESMIRVLGGSQ